MKFITLEHLVPKLRHLTNQQFAGFMQCASVAQVQSIFCSGLPFRAEWESLKSGDASALATNGNSPASHKPVSASETP
jgi:hypothetical protein